MVRLKLALLSGAAATALCTPALAGAMQDAPKSGATQAGSQVSAPASSVTLPAAPEPQTAPATQEQDKSQPTDEDADGEETSQVADVVVSAQSDGIRTSIDAISYSLANDLQATTGSLADALRNIPSVDVDPQGNVALRGNTGVTIWVDGRPSAILRGEGRGQALLQLPADQYTRIEVITNPSAAHTPEGSAGIINLITKPSAPKPGVETTGSVRVNVGDHGRWNLGLSGSRKRGRLTLAGDFGYRYDEIDQDSENLRQLLNNDGSLAEENRFNSITTGNQIAGFVRSSATYDLNDRTSLVGELNYSAFAVDSNNLGQYENSNSSGDLIGRHKEASNGEINFGVLGGVIRLIHKFDKEGHEWSNDFSYDDQSSRSDFLNAKTFNEDISPLIYERIRNRGTTDNYSFNSAYVRPLGDGGRLRAGYRLDHSEQDQRSVFRRGASEAGLSVVDGLSYHYDGQQTLHALYTTYERPLTPKLTAQFGLRLEQMNLEISDRITGLSASQDYFKAYPTGHVQYLLSETQTLRASYSRRIYRPSMSQLNPSRYYQESLYVRSGNPDLKPEETDSFEAMWQLRKGPAFYQATLYYRDTDKAFSQVVSELPDGLLLMRPENLGSSRNLGLELTASGRLNPKLRYNTSVNVFRQEIDAAGIQGGQDREGTTASGRFSLSWQATDKDFVQLSGNWQSERLMAQGVLEPGGMINLGYRHKLNDRLAINVTGRDLFNTLKYKTIYESPNFRDTSDQNVKLRGFYIGLSWALGTNPSRQSEQFDFSGPG